MKLSRLSVVLLLALALLGGGLAVAPDVAADTGCVEHCDDSKKEEEAEEPAADIVITGGTVTSSTTLDISVDGGTAISDASGGDFNTAVVTDGGVEGDVAAAGNGGTATASANGGAVAVGDVNSGGNSGNSIVVSSGGGDECKEDCDHEDCKDCKVVEEEEKKVVEEEEKKTTETTTKDGGNRGGTKVTKLASTGVGVQGESGASDALVLLATLGALSAAGYGLRRRFV